MLVNPITERLVLNFIEKAGSPLALIGTEGVGKIYLAELIADKILNTKTIKNHPYIFVLDAKMSGIDQVRELQNNLKLVVPGKQLIKRMVIIDNFDSFGREAQNALLKIIEEPPIDTQIIILINSVNFVLPTILSRVQAVNVLPVSLDQSQKYFMDQYSENEIKRAYNISAGNSELMQNIISNNDSSHLIINIERAKQILSLEKYERIAQIDKLIKEKDTDIPLLLESFVKILNATYIQSLQKPQTSLTNLNRLSYALKCIDNLALGVNKKLALTQFFSKI